MHLLAADQLIHCVDRFRQETALPTPCSARHTRKRLKNESGLAGNLSNRYARSETAPKLLDHATNASSYLEILP